MTRAYRHARANGGYLTHAVVGNTSLCGHTPKHTAHMMRQRGRWIFWKDEAWHQRPITCGKCLTKIFGPKGAK